MPRVRLPTLLSRKLAYRNPIPSDGVAVCGPIKISTIEPHSLSRYVTQTEPLAAFVCSDSYELPEIDHVRTSQALPRRALADQFPPHYRSTFIAPTFIAAANFIILGHIIRRLGPGYSRLAPRSCEHLHLPSIFRTRKYGADVLRRCSDFRVRGYFRFAGAGIPRPSFPAGVALIECA